MNPKANNCCGEQDAREWAKCLNEEVTFVNVLETKDMKGFVLGLNPEDEIIVAGGDGTLHHFANDVAEIEVEKTQLATRILQYGDIILEKSGGSDTQAIGRVVLFDKTDNETYSYSNFCSRIRVLDTSEVDPLYLWIVLHNFYCAFARHIAQAHYIIFIRRVQQYFALKGVFF